MQDAQSRQGLLITAPEPDTGDLSDQANLPLAPDLWILRKNNAFLTSNSASNPGKSDTRVAMEKGLYRSLKALESSSTAEQDNVGFQSCEDSIS